MAESKSPDRDTWERIKFELSNPWGAVNLKVDGYDVSLRISRKNPLRFVIVVYVNGHFKGRWMLMNEESEEGRRFFPILARRVLRGKRRVRYIDAIGKRAAKTDSLLQECITYRLPYWSSVDALRRHFVKHNQSIEVVSIGHAASA